jgi:anti-sigma B factor antagonist
MKLSVEHVGDVTVAKLCSEALTMTNVKSFRSEMEQILRFSPYIVLDMGALCFIDSSGIGALLSCINKARSVNGAVRLCAVTRPVQNILELVRADRFVQIFDVVDDAVRSFEGEEGVA